MDTTNAAAPPASDRPVSLISVITPVYNGSRYLEELIASVQGQSHPRLEHIVVDDGSDDDGATLAVLARYPQVRSWTRPNRGQYATLNEGLAAARGDWICIISADDALASTTCLEELVHHAEAAEPLDAAYGRTVLMDSDGAPVPGSHRRVDESAPPWLNRHFLVIHHCSLLVSRKFLVDNGLFFDTSLRFTGDWDWIIRILKAGRSRYFDVVVSRYRMHAQQTRQVTRRAELVAEDRLVLRRHGASVVMHHLVVNYFRVKKGLAMVADDGLAATVKAVARFAAKR